MEQTRRRRRPRENQQCRRESCTRKRNGTYCTRLCEEIDQELQTIQALIKATQPGKVTGELWASAVNVNDALTETYRLASVLRHITERQASESNSSNLGAQTLVGETSDQALNERSNLAPVNQTFGE